MGGKKASVMKELPSDIWHPLLLSSLNQQRERRSGRGGNSGSYSVAAGVNDPVSQCVLRACFVTTFFGFHTWREAAGTHIKYLVEEKVTVIRLLHLLEKPHDFTYNMKGRSIIWHVAFHHFSGLDGFGRENIYTRLLVFRLHLVNVALIMMDGC